MAKLEILAMDLPNCPTELVYVCVQQSVCVYVCVRQHTHTHTQLRLNWMGIAQATHCLFWTQ